MRALKEGGVGVMIFIFSSEKLLYFFLGLCDYWHYSDKFPKMFCSSWGMPLNRKFLSSMWSAT